MSYKKELAKVRGGTNLWFSGTPPKELIEQLIEENNKFTNDDLIKIREYAKSKNWELGNNAFSLDRGKLKIRRFEIGLYKNEYKKLFNNNDHSLRYKLDAFIIQRIKELLGDINGTEMKIIFVDNIKDDSLTIEKM